MWGSLDQAHIDSFKRFPLYNRVFVPEHNTYSNYNGLQVGITRQTGRAHYNVNYTFSKALGILGTGGSSTYSYPSDPFNYANDYTNMPFDRRHILNASYSYEVGNLVQNKWIGEATNGWEISGIVNYQSGANLPSIVSSNFGLSGSITVPTGTVAAVSGSNSSCSTILAGGTCQFSLSSTNLLGTPDVNLQPRLIGNPGAKTQSHQYLNAAAFGLPALGTNGAYKYGFLPGPGFFDSDLTASKRFRITEASNVQLRFAAFHFTNHANNSFTPVNTQNYTMNFSQTSNAGSLNQALLGSSVGNGNQFGFARLKEGRRIVELGLRYDF